tara:strand:+ start:2791 stop:5055 length:2265 start_codon:yes stop_codon:yes gene_type:complete
MSDSDEKSETLIGGALKKTSLLIKTSKKGKKYITIKGKKMYLKTLLKRINKKRIKSGKKPYKSITKRNIENTLIQLLFKKTLIGKEKLGKTTALKRQRGRRGMSAAQKRAIKRDAVQQATLDALKDLNPEKFNIKNKFKDKIDEQQKSFISELNIKPSESLTNLTQKDFKLKNEVIDSMKSQLLKIWGRQIGEKKISKTDAEGLLDIISTEITSNNRIWDNSFNFYGKKKEGKFINPLKKPFSKDQQELMPSLQNLRNRPLFNKLTSDNNKETNRIITNSMRAWINIDKDTRKDMLDLSKIIKETKEETKEERKRVRIKIKKTEEKKDIPLVSLDLFGRLDESRKKLNILKLDLERQNRDLEKEIPIKKNMIEKHNKLKELDNNYWSQFQKDKATKSKRKTKLHTAAGMVMFFRKVKKILKDDGDKDYINLFPTLYTSQQKNKKNIPTKEIKNSLDKFHEIINNIPNIKENINIVEKTISNNKEKLTKLDNQSDNIKKMINDNEEILRIDQKDYEEKNVKSLVDNMLSNFNNTEKEINTLIDNTENIDESLKSYEEVKEVKQEGSGSEDNLVDDLNKLIELLKKQDGGMLDQPEQKLSNFEIEKHMERYDNFYGVYAKDMLYKVIPLIEPGSKGGVIMNLDNHGESGSHWVAIYWDAKNDYSIEYFDSFGREPPKETLQDITKIIKKLKPKKHMKLKINRIENQDKSSVSCGLIAMRFIMDRIRGKNFKKATGYGIKKSEDMAEKMYERFNYIE